MSKIQETAEKMKKKISFNDYEKPAPVQNTEPVASASPTESPSADQKTKITFYLDNTIEDKINDMLISRMKERLKVNRSMIICRAIELMHEIEEKEGILSL